MLKRVLSIFSVFCLLFTLGKAHAQSYPNKSIRLIVPFGAGTSVDALARAIGSRLSTEMGQPVIVENKVGASGIVAAQYVANAAPDGYTLMVGTSTVYAVNPVIFAKLPYDPANSFTPITMIGMQPLVVVANPKVPANNLQQLIALAGKTELTAGSVGGFPTLATALFAKTTNTRILDVPYKGAAMVGLLGGEIDMMIEVISAVKPHIQSGKLKALAVTTEKRSPLLPDVPTLSETCCSGFDLSTWNAVVGPAHMPPAVVRQLNSALGAVLGSSTFAEPFESQGLRVAASTPDYLSDFMKREMARWRKVAADANFKPQ